MLLFATAARAADYYVSPSGDDRRSGRTPSESWRTVAPVNRLALRPGDRVLFEGGKIFRGTLVFGLDDGGSATRPVLLTSYGMGRATIYSGTGGGVLAYNTAGFEIRNLHFLGAGSTANMANGINFYTDLPGHAKLEHVSIDHVEVSGYGENGIILGGSNGRSGYQSVRITHADVHDNGRNGVLTYSQAMYGNEDVYVSDTKAYRNSGKPGLLTNTGSGIVLGGVRRGTIERSVAHDNGWLCDAPEGPVGIWAWNAREVVIQSNESYRNRTAGLVDGGGFDLDQNVSHSVLQYNYSHENDGSGFLLAHGPTNDPRGHANNVVRYNISQNDARKNAPGAIHVWGRIRRTQIYNNTVYVRASVGGTPAAVRITGPRGGAEVYLRNNVFQVEAGVPFVVVDARQQTAARGLRFEGNAYHSASGSFGVRWGTAAYSALEAWRSATGQETLAGAATGTVVDPRLRNPGGGSTLDDAALLETLTPYELRADSPLVDTGLPLDALFGIDPGTRDFFGTPIPQGLAFDVGADER